jgi:hypothetical protein
VVFDRVFLIEFQKDVVRNIVSVRDSQDLFDDLTSDPTESLLAQKVEAEVQPPLYRSATPVIDRPFEDAEWFNAINWPFKNWQASRFSNGAYGVWYGSDSVETSVYESAYHWHRSLLTDAGYEHLPVVSERKVYSVACSAALLDLRGVAKENPDLLHPSDYSLCQLLGSRIHREGHPGLLSRSVRSPDGEIVAIFNPRVLSNPRTNCFLTYRLDEKRILVEKNPGETWFTFKPKN